MAKKKTSKKSSSKKKSLKKSKSINQFETVHPNAAGIDIGSEEHWICVPKDRDDEHVKKFGAFTCDLYNIADWLKKCGVTSVAMESTSIYWIPLFQILEKKGFEVFLVNARSIKNVPGRTKTDRLDCQWIQKLHSFGLLAPSFRPDDLMCQLRSFFRHRDNLIKMVATHNQHIQKSLELMNIKLVKIVSDITGVTSMRIIKAIAEGEKDPKKLAELKITKVKASKKEIAKSLEGDYRPEHIFSLKQSLNLYEFTKKQILECDLEVEKFLNTMEKKIDSEINPPPPKKRTNKSMQNNNPNYDSHKYFYEIAGIDLTQIPSIGPSTTQTLISETGLDMNKWRTDKHFTSWLGLSPNHKISAGKILSKKTKKVQSRAARAFRQAASSLKNSKTYLGAFYRRLRARLDAKKAITATARKLAVIYYHMLKNQTPYKELGEDYYLAQSKERSIKKLQRQAKKLGFILTAQ